MEQTLSDRDLDYYLDCIPEDLLQGTFIVQYNKAHHIVVYCAVIVTSQSPDSNLDRDLYNFTPRKRAI